VRIVRNPVVQFLALGILAVAVIVVLTNRLSEQAAQEEAIAESRTATEILGRSVAEPYPARSRAR